MRLFLLPSVFLLAAASSFGQQLSVALSSGSAAPGRSVSLSISLALNGGPQPASLQWTLKYVSEDFDSIEVTAPPASTAAGKNLICQKSPGSVSCLLIGINTNPLSAGVVAIATLQVSSSTPHQSTAIDLANVAAASPQADAIPASGTGGAVTIVPPSSTTAGATNVVNTVAGKRTAASPVSTKPRVPLVDQRSGGQNGASANRTQDHQ